MKVEKPKTSEIPKKGDLIRVFDVLGNRWRTARVMSEPKAGEGSWWGCWGFKITYEETISSFTTYQNKRWEIGGY